MEQQQQNGVNPPPLAAATAPEWSCGGRATATFIVAATILLVGIIAWLAYLTAAKADRQEKAVTATAVTAKATATPQPIDFTEKVRTLEAALAAAKAKADAASAKADKAIATASQAKAIADNALKKAQAAVSARARQADPAPRAGAGPQTRVGPAPDQVAVPRSGVGGIWLWHHYQATADKPMPCIISEGDGRGIPPYCKGFSVKGANPGETKAQWLLRVGGGGRAADTGTYTKKD